MMKLYFIRDAGHGDELWKTDGISVNTRDGEKIFSLARHQVSAVIH